MVQLGPYTQMTSSTLQLPLGVAVDLVVEADVAVVEVDCELNRPTN